MKYIFGATLTLIGLAVMVWWGPVSMLAPDPAYFWPGVFMVLVGGIMAFSGGILAANWDASPAEAEGGQPARRRLPMSKILFSLCFLGTIGLLLIGLWNVFAGTRQIGPSLYLMVVGFIGAFASALAALAQE